MTRVEKWLKENPSFVLRKAIAPDFFEAPPKKKPRSAQPQPKGASEPAKAPQAEQEGLSADEMKALRAALRGGIHLK